MPQRLSRLALSLFAAMSLGIAGPAAAAVVTTTVDSVVNGVLPAEGNTPLNTGAKNTGVVVAAGDTVTISTAATDRWNINGFQVTAAGFPDGYFGFTSGSHNHGNFNGLTELTPIDYGALAYSLDGINWAAAYNDATLATSRTFTALTGGNLLLAMWDTVVSDNGINSIGSESNILTVSIDVVPAAPSSVPEPGTLALLGLAVAGIGASRRGRTTGK